MCPRAPSFNSRCLCTQTVHRDLGRAFEKISAAPASVDLGHGEPSGHPDRAGNLSKNRLAVRGTAYVGVLSRERVSSSDEFNPCACSHQYAPLTPARRAINCFIPNLRNSPALTSLYHDQYSWLLQRFPSRSQEAHCGSLQPAPLLQSPAERRGFASVVRGSGPLHHSRGEMLD